MVGFPISTPYFGQRPQVDPWLGWPVAATPRPSYAGQLPAVNRAASGGSGASQPAPVVENQGPNDRPLTRLLAKLRDRRQARGKDTGFLDAWLNAGGAGSGFLRDKYAELGQNIEAGSRPFLASLRNNSNALLLGGAGILSGQRGAFGPAFAQGVQIDQQNADYRRQLAAQQAQQYAISSLISGSGFNPQQQAYLQAFPDQAAPLIGGALFPEPTAGPEWEPYTSPEGWRGQRNTTTGQIDWDPSNMQPQPEGQGFRLLTGEEVAAANANGTPLNPGQPYKINEATGEVSTVGGQATGFALDIDPDTGAISFRQGTGVAGNIPQTARTAATYALRMEDAEATFSNPAVLDDVNLLSYLADQNFGAVGNYFQNPQQQLFAQATRSFINAQLRRESGAVISDDEFTNARRQYIPMPGDSPEVLAQKARNRQVATAGLRLEGGAAYDELIGAVGAYGGQQQAAPPPTFGQAQTPGGYGQGAPTFGWPGQQAPPLIGQPQTQQEPISIPANEVTPADVQATVQEWIRAGLSEEQALQAISNRTGIPLQQLQQMLRTQ